MSDLRDALVLRAAAPGDEEAVGQVLDAAFAPGGEESIERRLLGRLAAGGHLIDELTFVAEVDGQVIGQVACSRGRLGEADAVGLGPISVRPDLQRRGIGASLMSAVIATADRRGDPVLVLLGDPDYYAFFGFVPASTLGIGSPGEWPGRYFQAKPMRAWRPELAGPFAYAAPFAELEER